MTSRWRRALAAGAVLAIAVACVELGGPKSGVTSISNLRLPYPSVVIGGLLRDSLGVPSPLSITAFGPNGETLAEAISFIALDSSISVDADGTVHGLLRDSLGGRVVAGAGGLQTPPHRIIVTYAPVEAVKSTATTAIQFDAALPDTTEKLNWSPPLELTLNGDGGLAQGYIVTYQLTRTPPAKVAGEPTAYVADENGRAMTRDTTDTKGVAARRIVLRQAATEDALRGGTRTDTVIVRATVKYLGSDVPGSPVEFVVPVSRKP
ncbi:MAG TPA: hypothetical protein VFO55_07965 [Gemmatimonadaceae bacterium]|nr:hypothetical protein [Gemmatimonadaceae bacterium]